MVASSSGSSVTASQENARAVFVTAVRNTHALEKEARQLMERQIERAGDYPELAQRLRQHLDETNAQEERLDKILEALGADRSVIKDFVTQLMANVATMAHAPADDEILKNAFANNAFENYEIAAYRSLITIAEAAGQTQHVPMLQQTLQEEQRMADWVAGNIENFTRRYIQGARTGVT